MLKWAMSVDLDCTGSTEQQWGLPVPRGGVLLVDSRYSDIEEYFPVLDGDPVDTCVRLSAELHSLSTITVLTVHGELDAYTQNRWRYILDTALTAAEESGRLAVDIGDAHFLGCGSALDLARRAQLGAARGIQVSVVAPVPSVLDRIVTITGLTEWLQVHHELAEVLTSGSSHRRAGRPPPRPTALALRQA